MSALQHIEKQREFFRISLQNALYSEMSISSIQGKRVAPKNTQVLIEDIGPGGLRFLSHLKLPISSNVILRFETQLLGKFIQLHGCVVWKKELKSEELLIQYGLKFTIDESTRKDITPVLNTLAIRLRRNPIVQKCNFILIDKVDYFKNYIL